jgi:hypothetical protein
MAGFLLYFWSRFLVTVKIFRIFSPNITEKKVAILTQITAFTRKKVLSR